MQAVGPFSRSRQRGGRQEEFTEFVYKFDQWPIQMHVAITAPDGTETNYFGVADFCLRDDGVFLAFRREADIPEGQKYQLVNGTVERAVSEPAYDAQGAFETIDGITVEGDTSVVVAATNTNNHVVSAALEIQEEENPDNLTVLTETPAQ